MDEQRYAISEYPDVDAIYTQLKALTSQPVRPIRREVMEEILRHFDQNRRGR